jgi:uncharacterized protein YaiE (UPF0345 family)
VSSFENVKVDIPANVYFDGKVTSRKVTFESGEVKTLGIMLPGDYRFSTAQAEIMAITSGELEVKLPESQDWTKVRGGEEFHVPAEAQFEVRVKTVVDYCCSYID